MAWSLTKACGVVSVAIGILASPFIYTAIENNNAMQARIQELDAIPTIVFNSVAACTDQGYSKKNCEESLKAATSLANGLGTELTYESRAKCIVNHGACDETTTTTPVTTMVGNTIMVSYITTTSYDPRIVAWQAARDDLSKAVPLYQTPHENTAVRIDGHTFAIH